MLADPLHVLALESGTHVRVFGLTAHLEALVAAFPVVSVSSPVGRVVDRARPVWGHPAPFTTRT